MYLRIVFEIIVAAFAAIGISFSVRYAIQRSFGSKNILIAIEFLTQRDAGSAEEIIRDALSQYIYFPSAKIIAIATRNIASMMEFKAVLKKYGVSMYILDDDEKEIEKQ